MLINVIVSNYFINLKDRLFIMRIWGVVKMSKFCDKCKFCVYSGQFHKGNQHCNLIGWMDYLNADKNFFINIRRTNDCEYWKCHFKVGTLPYYSALYQYRRLL